MIVCIAEKPSVAREIADVIGARNKKEGYIETNKFIADSISDFINTSNLDKDTLSISNSPKSDMVINLPLDTVKLLNFIAKKYDVQISDIVFTALGHIIPVLMTYIEECGGYDEK